MILDSRSNSIAFLRFFLASMVVLTHSFMLGGFKDPFAFYVFNSYVLEDLGSIAVAGFFVLSGFLIAKSYGRLNSIPRFLWHRILRIFPGYLVCLLVTALIIGTFIFLSGGGTALEYFSYPENNPLTYITKNLFLTVNQRLIANVFTTNPYPLRVNDSVWTLRFEFLCYISIIFFGITGIFKKSKITALTFFIFLWIITNIILKTNVLPEGILNVVFITFKLFMFFYAGVVTFLYKEKVRISTFLFLLSILVFILSTRYGFYLIIAPFIVSYIIFYLSIKLPWRHFDKYGDFSYGLYIYSFPLQQSLVYFHFNKFGALLLFLWSMLIGTLAAFLSWRSVESPALRLKNVSISRVKHVLKSYKFKNRE